VCDAAARLETANSSRPMWINYTGGDRSAASTFVGQRVAMEPQQARADRCKGFLAHRPCCGLARTARRSAVSCIAACLHATGSIRLPDTRRNVSPCDQLSWIGRMRYAVPPIRLD